MNELIQQESMLICSEQDAAFLAKKERARLLVLSDSHGQSETVKKIITLFAQQCDALVFCGDGFCDIAFCMEQALQDDKFKEMLPPVIAAVRGNGDADTYPIKTAEGSEENEDEAVYRKLLLPQRLEFTAAGRNILVVHGHRHGVDWGLETLTASAYTMDADMVFFGHTHRAFWEESGATLLLNPGSCSHPRSRLPPSFALVSFPGERERFSVEFFGIEEALFGNIQVVPLAL